MEAEKQKLKEKKKTLQWKDEEQETPYDNNSNQSSFMKHTESMSDSGVKQNKNNKKRVPRYPFDDNRSFYLTNNVFGELKGNWAVCRNERR